MKTTVETLKELYIKLGGSLDDTYEEIADGAAVAEYSVVPDCIEAINEVANVSSGDIVAEHENGTVTIKMR